LSPDVDGLFGFSTSCNGIEIPIQDINLFLWVVVALTSVSMLLCVYFAVLKVVRLKSTWTAKRRAVTGGALFGLLLFNTSILVQGIGLFKPSLAICSAEPWLLFLGAGAFLGTMVPNPQAWCNSIWKRKVGPALIILIPLAVLVAWTVMQPAKPAACMNYMCGPSPYRTVLLVFFLTLPLIQLTSAFGWRDGRVSGNGAGKVVLAVAAYGVTAIFFALALAFQFTLEKNDPPSDRNINIVVVTQAAVAFLVTVMVLPLSLLPPSQPKSEPEAQPQYQPNQFHDAALSKSAEYYLPRPEGEAHLRTASARNQAVTENKMGQSKRATRSFQDSKRTSSAWDEVVMEKQQQEERRKSRAFQQPHFGFCETLFFVLIFTIKTDYVGF
jgi:hypothetical protein